MKNARLIEIFTAQAREYQRRMRLVSQEMRDLRALEHAQSIISDHTGRSNQDLADALGMLEGCIVDSLGLDHARG